MAKKTLFSLILCIIHLALASILSASEPLTIKNRTLQTEQCSAPPPDSFRVTGKSTNFISLAWKTAWPGATQTLNVFEENSSGGWNLIYPSLNVIGETFIVENLTSGRTYKFEIATNCGQVPSELTSIIKDGTLIVELTINGRVPKNPFAVNCADISKSYEWKGFKMEYFDKLGNLKSNLFEFGYCGDPALLTPPQPCIMRVDYNNSIVATNDAGIWPNLVMPEVYVLSPFRMGYRPSSGSYNNPIGKVLLIEHPNTIRLCADYLNVDIPWDNNFTFTALAANEAYSAPSSDYNARDKKKPSIDSEIKVQNPFQETINVFLPPSILECKAIKISILNITGQIIKEYQIDNPVTSISLPTNELASGLYLVRIEYNRNIYTLKAVKYS